MALLLYKSNEMFSSTELIRKSKMIFDKIVNDEIEKAIILRDGKPGFLLMDFQKYESIMSDYEKLKNDYEKIVKEKPKKKINKPSVEIKLQEPETVLHHQAEPEKEQVDKKSKMEKLLNSLPTNIEVKKELEEFKPQTEFQKEDSKNTEIEEIQNNKNEPPEEILNEEDEINDALFKIKDLDFSPEEKAKVEAQIKERIKKARLEREKLLQEQDSIYKEELKEELQLQVHLKEENKKKEQELKEFWD